MKGPIVGAPGMKLKLKPTHPKPFRLRTDVSCFEHMKLASGGTDAAWKPLILKVCFAGKRNS